MTSTATLSPAAMSRPREQIEAATRHGALLLEGVQRGAVAMATTHETCDEAHARQLGA